MVSPARAPNFTIQVMKGRPDDVPGVATIVAAVHAATAGVKRPAAGIEAIAVARVNDDVGDHIVLARADAADHLPVRTFVTGGENVAVGGAQEEASGVARVSGKGNNGPARGAGLTPNLSRNGTRESRGQDREAKTEKCSFHIVRFSQRAARPTRRKSTESG